MNVYVLRVSDEDFAYDKIEYVVVLAENSKKAIEIAKQSRDVSWEVEKELGTNKPGLIHEDMRYG